MRQSSRYMKFLMVLVVITLVVTLAVSVQLHFLDEGSMQSSSLSADLHNQLQDSSAYKKPISTPKDTEKKHVKSSTHPVFEDPERKPILNILRNAGYNLNDAGLFTPDLLNSLPRWSEVLDLYGEKPVVLGLDTCEKFRADTSQASKRQVAPAGLFNSGTNILHNLLMLNCQNRATRGASVMWQVPWGKHMPEDKRESNRAKGFQAYNISNVLPVVSIRDPYTWMQSMCRQAYAVQFDHSTVPELDLCPNLVPYEEDIRAHPRYKNKEYIPVHAKFANQLHLKYTSLAHLYNEWYNAYLNVTKYPRLMVRLEDIIFRAEEVVPKICECYGGEWMNRKENVVHHHAHVANRNTGIDMSSPTSGLLGSIIKYGNRTLRRRHYRRIQFVAAKEVLDPQLMEHFGYCFEDP